MITGIVAGVCMVVGLFIGYVLGEDRQNAAQEILRNKVQTANRQAGKLSKIIHRQRLMIKKLKAYVPATVRAIAQ